MPSATAGRRTHSLHALGVVCGLAAGVWLGAAEAPTKLVTAGLSPFAISLCMVAGVFTARWTFPTLLKGTGYVFTDLAARKHLLIWALLAGCLWAVANTLTVFAIRDVGLATAFPLWNTNSLIGLLWGRVLFRELEGAQPKNIAKVVLGALLIVAAAIMLGFSTLHGGAAASPHATRGLIAAGGASLMWGTMYVPYRKAYLSGMNPLSFVTAFTVGELGMMLALTLTLDHGAHNAIHQIATHQGLIFWLFLGGFVWVIGDLFQQFATKYLGIGRGIPLSNTNQFWGLMWGALVFGELAAATHTQRLLVIAGSALMILGALAIGTAVASSREHASNNLALERECDRYGLDYNVTLLAQTGDELSGPTRRRWWDYAIAIAATAFFVILAARAVVPPLPMNVGWVLVLSCILIAALIAGGWLLLRSTRFT
ncbi:MAG TPA: GRP family sugar transporter [Acidobacteriaceae bacterium]